MAPTAGIRLVVVIAPASFFKMRTLLKCLWCKHFNLDPEDLGFFKAFHTFKCEECRHMSCYKRAK